MSADNGIYIAKFPDGYRVAHAQAIENIDFFPPGSEERKYDLKVYFGDAPKFDSGTDAITYAWNLTLEYDILEYGVQYLGEYESFEIEQENNKMAENVKNKFWIVVNEKFPTTITCKHSLYDSAFEEAKRLARKNPDSKFVVMESQIGFVVDNMVETKYVDPQNNPEDPD